MSTVNNECAVTGATLSNESTSTGSVFSLYLEQGLIAQNFSPDNSRACFSSCSLDNLSWILLLALASGALVFINFNLNALKANC